MRNKFVNFSIISASAPVLFFLFFFECADSKNRGDGQITDDGINKEDFPGQELEVPDESGDAGPQQGDAMDILFDEQSIVELDSMDAKEGEFPISPFREFKGIIHIHTPYSHDACDGHGISEGVVDYECMMQLRMAACDTGMDFVALTDHPAYMKDYSMQEDLLYLPSEGDNLVLIDGNPVANVITCRGGNQLMLTVGFESSRHSMPIFLRSLLPEEELYSGVDDSTPMELVTRIGNAIEAAGGIHAVVHSESPEISPPRIIEAGFEAMEWVNLHALFIAVLGGDQITGNPVDVFNMIKGLEDFLYGSTGGPHPDLVLMKFLYAMPQHGFSKWVEVQRTKKITGVIGTDAHRNISIDPVCSGSWQTYCEIIAALFPNTLTLLITGGTITLSDGDRVDSYARMLRWVENRVFATDRTFEDLEDSIRRGRLYGLFSVFGDPYGFLFEGSQDGNYISMGDSVSGSVTLRIKAPERPVWMGGAPFNEIQADSAIIRLVLKKIDTGGVLTIVELNDRGAEYTETFSDPGAYYVEVWIRPMHLEQALAGQSELAYSEYLWLVTNPVRIQ